MHQCLYLSISHHEGWRWLFYKLLKSCHNINMHTFKLLVLVNIKVNIGYASAGGGGNLLRFKRCRKCLLTLLVGMKGGE